MHPYRYARLPGALTLVQNILRATLVLSSLWYLGCFTWLAAYRIDTPTLMEMNEGFMLDHVLWLLQGKEIYIKPNLEFTPTMYPPLFYELSILATKLIGTGLPALRSVSILSTFCMFALVMAIVHQQNRSRIGALAAAGFLAATYPLSSWWFDIARPDTLQVAMALGTVYCLLHCNSRKGRSTAALIFCLALFVKQTSLILLGPFIVGVLIRHPKHRVTFVLSFIGASLLSLIILSLRHGELWWAYFYLIELPQSHPWKWNKLISTLSLSGERTLLIALLLSAILVITHWKKLRTSRLDLYLLLLIGAVLTSFIGQLKAGGFVNHRIVFHVALAILFGLALASLAYSEHNSRHRPFWLATAVVLLAQLQMAVLLYSPSDAYALPNKMRPSPGLIASFSYPGEVLVMHHYGYLHRLDGGSTDIMTTSWGDLVWLAPKLPESIDLLQRARQNIESGRYSRVVSSHTWGPPNEWFTKHYQRTDIGPTPESGLLKSWTGARVYTRNP